MNDLFTILLFNRIVHKFLFECFLSEAITINIIPTNKRIPSNNIDQILNRKIFAIVTPNKFKDNPIANIILCGNDFTLFKIAVFLLHDFFASTNFTESESSITYILHRIFYQLVRIDSMSPQTLFVDGGTEFKFS